MVIGFGVYLYMRIRVSVCDVYCDVCTKQSICTSMTQLNFVLFSIFFSSFIVLMK